MTCKGICVRHAAHRLKDPQRNVSTFYGHSGHKRCTTCSMYINWDGLYCPCCSYQLRAEPRYRKRHEKKKEKRVPRLYCTCYLVGLFLKCEACLDKPKQLEVEVLDMSKMVDIEIEEEVPMLTYQRRRP